MDLTAAAIVFTVLILLAWLGSNYRALAETKSQINACRQRLDNALRVRQQLAGELPGKLGEYKKSNAELFAELDDKQKESSAGQNASMSQRQVAENGLGIALGKLFHAIEQNEEVLNNENYTSMREKFLIAEDEISAGSGQYNDTVARFNMQLKVFPTSFIGSRLSFTPEQELATQNPFEQYALKFKATMPVKKESSLFRGRAGKASKDAKNDDTSPT